MTNFIFLAGGCGRRMNFESPSQFKYQLEIGGESLLGRQIRFAKKYATSMNFVAGRYPNMLNAEIQKYYDKTFFITGNKYHERTEDLATLNFARRFITNPQPVVVCYTDIFYDESFFEIMMESDASIAIPTTEEGKFMGLIKFSRTAWIDLTLCIDETWYKRDRYNFLDSGSIMDAVDKIVREDEAVVTYIEKPGVWIDINTQEDYAIAKKNFEIEGVI